MHCWIEVEQETGIIPHLGLISFTSGEETDVQQNQHMAMYNTMLQVTELRNSGKAHFSIYFISRNSRSTENARLTGNKKRGLESDIFSFFLNTKIPVNKGGWISTYRITIQIV